MSLQTFLARISGRTKRVAPLVVSAGTEDAGRIIAADSSGRINQSLMPEGVGVGVVVATASETLSAGALVNLYSNSGTFSARLADNSNGREAYGFVLVAAASSGSASVYPLGEIDSSLSGLTPGADYWLGTAGGLLSTPLEDVDDAGANDGKLSQYVGKARSATELVTVRDEAVEL
jgi:hypothetical protein